MEKQFDYLEYFIMGMCLNSRLFPEIDKVYEKDSHLYYKEYRESNYYNNQLFELFTTEEFIHMKKLTGIVIHSRRIGNTQIVNGLIKKGFNPIYRYVTKQKQPDYLKIMELAKKGREIESVSETELVSATLVSFYMIEELKKPLLNHQAAIQWIQSIFNNYEGMVIAKHNDYQKQIESKRDAIDLWNEVLKADISNYNINNILDNLVEDDVEEVLKEKNVTREQISMDDYQKIRSYVFKFGFMSNKIGFLSGILKICGISESAYGTTLSKQKFEKVLAQYEFLKNENNLSEEESPFALIAVLVIAGLSKEYEDTRENSLREAEEKSFYEIEKNNEVSEKEIKRLNEDKSKLLMQLNTEKEKMMFLKKKEENQEREINRLKQELDKKNESEKELIALRNYIFEQSESNVAAPFDASQDEEILSKELIAIIGGNENWVKNMKKKFPDFIYIGANAVNVDLSILNRKGMKVFFNTATNSHAQYDRVMKLMSKNDNSFYYLNENANIDKTINQMITLIGKLGE